VKCLAIAVLLLGACAAPMHSAPAAPTAVIPPDVSDDLSRAERELRRLDAEVDALSAQAAPPGCERVTLLRDNICALADRICRLIDQYPQEPTLRPRCADGRQRCLRAAESAKQRGCGS
jgi:hypothetical protein